MTARVSSNRTRDHLDRASGALFGAQAARARAAAKIRDYWRRLLDPFEIRAID
jgi:hypothetical protein